MGVFAINVLKVENRKLYLSDMKSHTKIRKESNFPYPTNPKLSAGAFPFIACSLILY